MHLPFIYHLAPPPDLTPGLLRYPCFGKHRQLILE